MKVLFCGLKYEYGHSRLGFSFEYQNFYEVLKRMPEVECELFALDERMSQVGRDGLNAQLINEVEEKKPDLLFCFLFTDELKKGTIDYITKRTKTKTFNWFTDDHWRFDIYSKYWASLFSAVSTTDSQAILKYKHLGLTNVIKTQWAANLHLYKPVLELEIRNQKSENWQITFVGKKYPSREKYMAFLKKKGLLAEGYGSGWGKGRVDFENMLKIFSFSKINLNFTESAYAGVINHIKLLAKLFVKKELGKYKINIHNFFSSVSSAVGTRRRQIKGRTFEVPACGGFLLSGEADNIEEYYVPGREIVVFKDKNDLAEKCQYYLGHEEERKIIAKAGYERTIKEHSYEHRFIEIFKVLGLM